MSDKNKSNGMFTDREYIEALGLSPDLEGKPEINKAIVNKIREDTVAEYVKNGMDPNKARKIAMREVK